MEKWEDFSCRVIARPRLFLPWIKEHSATTGPSADLSLSALSRSHSSLFTQKAGSCHIKPGEGLYYDHISDGVTGPRLTGSLHLRQIFLIFFPWMSAGQTNRRRHIRVNPLRCSALQQIEKHRRRVYFGLFVGWKATYGAQFREERHTGFGE